MTDLSVADTWRRDDGFEVSTDKTRIDFEVVHGFLSRIYWAENMPREVMARAIEGSICFSVFDPAGAQVGFGRVITDRATFAWLSDIFVLESYRGRGLAKWMVRLMQDHPDLQGLRRWLLGTRDAQELYRSFGFKEVAAGNLMAKAGLPDGRYLNPKVSS